MLIVDCQKLSDLRLNLCIIPRFAVLTLAILCIVFWCVPAKGLEAETKLLDYQYRRWNVEHGLPQVTVRAVKQTSDGYLWTASDAGLSRFDGDQFNMTTSDGSRDLTSSAVNCLWTQKNDTLWVGGKDGAIACYRKGKYERIFASGTSLGLNIQCFCEDRLGRIWVGTSQGIRLFEEANPAALTPVFTNIAISINAILEDDTSQLWFATQRGLFICDTSNLKSIRRLNAVPEIPILALCPGQSSSMWIGSNEGLFHYSSGKASIYTQNHGLKDNRVSSLFRDSQGTLWIGTAMGINRFHKNGVVSEASIPALENVAIHGFTEDMENCLWIASASGMHCLYDPIFTTLSARNGFPDESIITVAEKKTGHMLLGTVNRGLFEMDKDWVFSSPYRTSANTINSLLVDRDNRLWVGVRRRGLDMFDKDRAINYDTNHGLLDATIQSLCEDRQNRLWIGTGKGLNCRMQDRIREISLPSSTNTYSVRTITEMKDGSLWIGTSIGLYALMPERTNHFTMSHGLPANLVYCVQQDSQGHMWVGTANGIACYFNGQFRKLAKPDPKTLHHVFWIVDDGNGYLWYSSNSGIFRFAIDEATSFFQNPSLKVRRRLFTQADGLLSSECLGGVQPAGCRTSDGQLWFPTRKGLAIVDPNRMPVNTTEPHVHLKNILVDGHSFPASDNMRLPPGTRLIEFQYAALSYKAMEKVCYQRKLKGIDADWSEIENKRSAVYANLAPGSYRFQVIACNSDGLWNKTGASISFQVLPPFYQTPWFYVVSGLTLGLATFGWRTLLLRKQKAALQQLVQERTRELEDQMAQRLKLEEQLHNSRKLEAVGQLASGVAHYFNNLLAIIQGNASLLQEGAKKDSIDYLNDITEASQRGAQLVRQLLAFARCHWINLQPMNVNRLVSEHIERLEKSRRNDIEILKELSPAPALVMADRITLDQAIAGLTSNALEAMSDGGTLLLRISHVEVPDTLMRRHPEAVPGKFVMLTISDTGKGMPPEILNRMFEPFFTTKDVGKGTGLGLAAVYGIVKQHNGWIETESAPGHGTTIRILLPAEPIDNLKQG